MIKSFRFNKFFFIFILFQLFLTSAYAQQTHYKMYCMYTPDFKDLFNEFFLPSIKDDFEIVAAEFPQDCPSGNFRFEGWNKTMLNKLKLLQKAILENWDQIFFYSDIDIIFLKPILDKSLELLGNNDFVVQQGWPKNKLCAGFFVMKGNEKNLGLITKAFKLLNEKVCVDDQEALQTVLNNLNNDEIAWELLPPKLYPNGRFVLKQSKELYSKHSLIELNQSMILFHANCCIGLENKYHFLKQVQQKFQENQYYEE